MRNRLSDNYIPVATYSIIGFNILLYLALLGADKQDVFSAYALSPRDATLLQMFTSTFLHSNAFHLLTNMVLFWLFGRKVEIAIGSVELLLFYIGSGFAASVMHVAIYYAFMPPGVSTHFAVGASGAIAGVLGIYAIRFYRDRFTIGRLQIPAYFVLLAWLLLHLVEGITGLYVSEVTFGWFKVSLVDVSYWSHLGGFIFGMGFAQLSRIGFEARQEYLLSDAREGDRRDTLLEVAQEFEALTETDPEDPFAYAELGRTWSLLGDVDQSIPCYEKAIKLYLETPRVDLAIERFTEMRNTWPDALLDPKLHFRMGCKLEESGAYEEAIEVLNQLALGYPETGEAEMAALRVGEIHLTRLNRPEFAIAAFNRFLKMFPNSEWRHFAEQSLARAMGGS